MPLASGSAVLGATRSRLLNRLAYEVANRAGANATVATDDVIVTYDKSADYEARYSTPAQAALAGAGGTEGTVVASSGLVVDSNRDLGPAPATGIRNLVITNLDTGASGTAGTVDVFPTTASKGKIQIAAADSTGNTTTTITNAAQSATATMTIPDTNGSASFVMTAANQTVGGVKTFSSMFRIPYNGSVSAAGTTATDAAALSEGLSIVTGANGTVGVKLPTPVAGSIVIIKGNTNGVLKVWPGGASSGVAINGLGADNSMSLASGLIPAWFIATSATQYFTFPLLPS